MVTKVLTNYARVLMFLEDLVSLPEDCGQNSARRQFRFYLSKRPLWRNAAYDMNEEGKHQLTTACRPREGSKNMEIQYTEVMRPQFALL